MDISLNNYTCPHCLKENATLFCSAIFTKPLSEFMGMVFTCKSCEHSLIIELDETASTYYNIRINNDNDELMMIDNGNSITNRYNNNIGSFDSIYPQQQSTTIPDYLSDIVSKNFREAKELFIKNYINPSAMASRRAIDLATKELLPEYKGMLNGRIKILLDNNIITQQLYDWANFIRLDGNSANHDYEDFTEEQAKQLLDFTEMFLLYAFTLPKMVEIKQTAKTED